MSIRVFVPIDSVALSLGANEVATALQCQASQRSIDLQLVRNSSRGLFWLEPLLEVETPLGRFAYGPVSVEDVESLLDAHFYERGEHPLYQGAVEEIPYLKNQERLTFARAGITDPQSLQDYLQHEGYSGLGKALEMTPESIVKSITLSGLRGRGGAAFPTGIKWKTVLDAVSDQKYIVCNADEGDSGTFSDRMIMEGDPFMLIEGMTIAALAVEASEGYIYVRSEYPYAFESLQKAINTALHCGYLGDDILGSGKVFNLRLRKAAGSYVCGEETAMLDSLEGKRGMVRAKPPLPAMRGLFAKPTVINNVISLATVAVILARGAEYYRDFGVGRSRGTLPIQLAGNIRHGGLVEKAFGITLRALIDDFGRGTESGRPLRAVQVGGPLGAYLPDSRLDVMLDYEALQQIGGSLGHGGIVVFDDSVDMAQQAQFAMQFCELESCGKCTPCRIGATRGVEVIEQILRGDQPEQQIQLLQDLCSTMLDGSLCAMGGMTPFPVLSALEHFPEDFNRQAVTAAA